ncbi:MAG: hypothetical protein JNL67_22640 [Planctomycetaceae bacterium]|nr:hypothetical protein [Planctomycetaceae bacterium]
MNRVKLPSAIETSRLTLARIAAVVAIAAVLLGLVSLLLTNDLPEISHRLWDVALGATILSVLVIVIVYWLKLESAHNSEISEP